MGGRSVSIDREEVGDNWPLIRFLLDDPVYHQRYVDCVGKAVELLDPDGMADTYERLADLIGPYIAADSQAAFETAVQALTENTATQSMQPSPILTRNSVCDQACRES